MYQNQQNLDILYDNEDQSEEVVIIEESEEEVSNEDEQVFPNGNNLEDDRGRNMFTPPNKDQPAVKDLILNKHIVALDKSGMNTKNSEYGDEGEGWESEEEEENKK